MDEVLFEELIILIMSDIDLNGSNLIPFVQETNMHPWVLYMAVILFTIFSNINTWCCYEQYLHDSDTDI